MKPNPSTGQEPTPAKTAVATDAPAINEIPEGTEECPLNGRMYSKEYKNKWDKRRPLGIMIENSVDARPQSGLSSADVIYEAVAEGGITRFLTLFYCLDSQTVGPVRSARMYFLDTLRGYGESPLYGHVGGANTPGPADALGMIRRLGWQNYNDMDQFAIGMLAYRRDYDRLPNVATEHTMYTNTEKLWSFAKTKRKLTEVNEEGARWDKLFKKWKFADGKPSKEKTTNSIAVPFWTNVSYAGDYLVNWKYDITSNTYLRFHASKPHLDKNTDKQIAPKNVVIMFAQESVAKDGYEGGQHLLYDIIGTGDALVFQNGKAIKATWVKEDSDTLARFTDASTQKEIEFVRGQTFVQIVPTGNKVTY